MCTSCRVFNSRTDTSLVSLAWRCFDGEPKVDYQKLANLAGMSNPRSASNAWAVIKKKLAAQADANGDVSNGGTASPTKPKATPVKKRGKKAAAEADDDDEQEAPSAKVHTLLLCSLSFAVTDVEGGTDNYTEGQDSQERPQEEERHSRGGWRSRIHQGGERR